MSENHDAAENETPRWNYRIPLPVVPKPAATHMRNREGDLMLEYQRCTRRTILSPEELQELGRDGWTLRTETAVGDDIVSTLSRPARMPARNVENAPATDGLASLNDRFRFHS